MEGEGRWGGSGDVRTLERGQWGPAVGGRGRLGGPWEPQHGQVMVICSEASWPYHLETVKA